VRADPRSTRCYVTQHRVEHRSGLPFMDRINPHEHSINRQELFAHLVGDVVVIDRRLGINAKCCQLFEDAVKAIVLGSCRSPHFPLGHPAAVCAEHRQPTVPLRAARVVKFRSENGAWSKYIRAAHSSLGERMQSLDR